MCDFLVGLDMHGLCMLVFGSLVVGGIVLLGFDNGFQPCLFPDAMVCWDFDLGFKLWNCWMDFGIRGKGGLKENSQSPRNSLTSFGGIHDKS